MSTRTRLVALAAVVMLGAACPPAATPTSNAGARIETSADASLRARARVILVTIDGLRWQEVFDAKDSLALPDQRPSMPYLHDRIISRGAGFGDLDDDSRVATSSRVPLSLPGYQAIFSGRQTACETNDCERVREPTFVDRVANDLDLRPAQVAAFASWSRMSRAVSSGDGAFVEVGPEGPPTALGPPWKNARWDEETLARALDHLQRESPRFLHIGLLDADERAHAGDRAGYVRAVRAADDALKRIDATLASLGPDVYALTTVIVTTDHGRGNGPLWAGHSRFSASKNIWLAARGPYVARVGRTAPVRRDVAQADLRPTIERLFGFCPTACTGKGCGRVIEELVSGLSTQQHCSQQKTSDASGEVSGDDDGR